MRMVAHTASVVTTRSFDVGVGRKNQDSVFERDTKKNIAGCYLIPSMVYRCSGARFMS